MNNKLEKGGAKALVSRVREMGWREATYLEHSNLRVMIDDFGGFTPELSCALDKRLVNAHWIPHFRSNTLKEWQDNEFGAFWKSRHLFNMAGGFPCVPNYGAGHIIGGENIPANGWTANDRWTFIKKGTDTASGAIWALSTMESPSEKMLLSFVKVDAIVPGQNVYYTSIKIKNSGSRDLEICAAWQSFAGPPMLSPGCRLSASAKEWITPRAGSEFDSTGILACDKEFYSLSKAPLAGGGTTDISVVGGATGHTDFVTGVVPKPADIGWQAIVNPSLSLLYLSFFPGPNTACEKGDVPLYFNNFSLQYGGRNWTPFAPYEGGTDLSYCVGAAGATSAWNYGLEFSREIQKLLGSPVTVTIPARGEKTLYYGTLFASYEDSILDTGVLGVEIDERHIICKSAASSWHYFADPTFSIVRSLQQGTANRN
jgi:hypothetical protein